MTLGPYARVYFTIWTDDRFVRIREDYTLLGVWLDLLMRAEAAWPESVAIPRRIPAEALAVMVEDGVIDLQPCDTYRIHGLDAERERRSAHAIEANRRRWHPDPAGTPPGTPDRLLAPRPRKERLDLEKNDGEKKNDDDGEKKNDDGGESVPSAKRSTDGQIVNGWLADHGIRKPYGWAIKGLADVVETYKAPAVLAVWEEHIGDGQKRTSQEWVRLAEQALRPKAWPSAPPALRPPTDGRTVTAEAADAAFQQSLERFMEEQ